MAKTLVSIRMSEIGRARLTQLINHLGLSQAGVIETALLELMKREGLHHSSAPAQDADDSDSEFEADFAELAAQNGVTVPPTAPLRFATSSQSSDDPFS